MQSSDCDRGVVPFENSTHGSVVFTLDLLVDREANYPDLQVCGETYLPVHHCLLGHLGKDGSTGAKQDLGSAAPTTNAPATNLMSKSQPLCDFDNIQHVYSHPQALGQCEIFLSKYLKHAERHEVSSTSKAAELIAADWSCRSAAISSRLAAELHDLDLLATNIQDEDNNATRFFVLRSTSTSNAQPATPRNTPDDYERPSHSIIPDAMKSLIAFKVHHSQPGALANALAVFKTHGLNLTSINSRPSREVPWHYVFLIEIDDGIDRNKEEPGGNGKVANALRDLKNFSNEPRFLGSWADQAKMSNWGNTRLLYST